MIEEIVGARMHFVQSSLNRNIIISISIIITVNGICIGTPLGQILCSCLSASDAPLCVYSCIYASSFVNAPVGLNRVCVWDVEIGLNHGITSPSSLHIVTECDEVDIFAIYSVPHITLMRFLHGRAYRLH